MDVLDEYRLKMSEIYRQIERGNSAETTGALYGKLNNIRRYIGRKLEPTRILTAQAKLKTAIRKARILVKHGEQVAVYCIHQDIQRALREAFSEKGIPMSIVNQKVTKKKRDEAVQDFQSGKSKIFLATIGTAGTGITLSAARHLIFVEIDWTPGAMSQTEDRIWRIGQEREPTIHYLVLRCSTDKKMLETIRRKQEHADSAIDGILTD